MSLNQAEIEQAYRWAGLSCLDPRCECHKLIPVESELGRKLWVHSSEDDIAAASASYVAWNPLCVIHGEFISGPSDPVLTHEEQKENLENWLVRMWAMCNANPLDDVRTRIKQPFVVLAGDATAD